MKKTNNFSKDKVKVEYRDYYDSGMKLVQFNERQGCFLKEFYPALDTAEVFLKKGHTLKTITDYISENYNTGIAKRTLAMLMQKHPLLVAEVFLNGEEEDVEILDSGYYAQKTGLKVNYELSKKYFKSLQDENDLKI